MLEHASCGLHPASAELNRYVYLGTAALLEPLPLSLLLAAEGHPSLPPSLPLPLLTDFTKYRQTSKFVRVAYKFNNR